MAQNFFEIKENGKVIGIECGICHNQSYHLDDIRSKWCHHCEKYLCDKSLLFSLKVAPGSSIAQVIEQLKAGHSCQCVATAFDVYIHHCDYHEIIAKAIGLTWDDRICDGNFSWVNWNKNLYSDSMTNPYIAVRLRQGPKQGHNDSVPQWPVSVIQGELTYLLEK